MAGPVEAKSLIIRREHIPSGKFIVARTTSRNNMVNEFVEGNLKMGDRMIVIREVDESLRQLITTTLGNWVNKSC